MAASTSRQPHHIPLPPSPSNHAKYVKGKRSNKGKGKENLSETVSQGPKGPSNHDSAWKWTPLTDTSVSKVPPIFTKDGSYFFSLAGSSVKIYSVTTGQVISTLSASQSTWAGEPLAPLTAMIINPHNAFQLITASLDGRLVVWDFLDAVLLQVIDIAQPIHYICAHKLFKDVVFVAASKPSKKIKNGVLEDNAVVLRVSLKPVDNTVKSSEILPIGKTRFPTGLTFSSSGTWLIATAGHKAYVAMTSSLRSGFTKYISPERLTCLTCHPTEEYFATGDEKGNIRLWYCLNDNISIYARGVEKKTQTATLHWHAHAVSSLAFTGNGAYLLSGGEESVLVVWQLHTGKKEFVPRVGAPINTVSVFQTRGGEEEYLLGLTDATYLFINGASLKVYKSYSRLKIEPVITNLPSGHRCKSSPLAIHTLTSTLLLPSSHPSSLQIYSPSSSKLVSELEISPSNRVSRRDDKIIDPPYVEQIVISSSGDWLASIDVQDGDGDFQAEIYLKLWRWDRAAKRWTLNTRIDRPHGLKRVNCLAFSPLPNKSLPIQLVTTGEDGNVKMWGIRTIKDKLEAAEEFWVARLTFGCRSWSARSASWSPDGSLLAVSFGHCVSIYDSTTNSLLHTFISSECRVSTSTHFIGKKGRYLVVLGGRDLVLWDVVTQSIRWNYKAPLMLDRVIPHMYEDSFAVFYDPSSSRDTQKTRVSIFRVGSPVPLSTCSVPFTLRNISLYPFSNPSSYAFIGITYEWGAMLIGGDAEVAEDVMATKILMGSDSTRHTLFEDIFGKLAPTDPPMTSTPIYKQTGPQNGKITTDAFEYPTYLMPPVEDLFEPLMSSFLKPRPDESPVHDIPKDEGMEEESFDTTPVRHQQTRAVKPEEMDIFVNLFRKYSIKCSPTSGTILV